MGSVGMTQEWVLHDNITSAETVVYAALGLALICKGEGKYDEAIDRLSKLIRDDDKNYRLYIDLADCYIKVNQKQKAVELLENFQKNGMRNQSISEMLDKLRKNKALY